MGRRMSGEEWRAFVSEGTRTAKLATVRRDGSPHVTPVWFVLDGDDLVFTTATASIKGRNLRRERRACLVCDLERPPYGFVQLSGPVTLSDDLDEMLPFAIQIGGRYMGADRAEAFGRRNAVDGELLVRLHVAHVYAIDDVAG